MFRICSADSTVPFSGKNSWLSAATDWWRDPFFKLPMSPTFVTLRRRHLFVLPKTA